MKIALWLVAVLALVLAIFFYELPKVQRAGMALLLAFALLWLAVQLGLLVPGGAL